MQHVFSSRQRAEVDRAGCLSEETTALILHRTDASGRGPMRRQIIHINAAAFPIQIARLLEPRYRTFPLVIAPPGERAVIYSVSAEARQAGIHPGMSVKTARQRFRDVVVVPPDTPTYDKVSTEMNQILGRLSPLIEPVTRGHTFVDITGTIRLFGTVQKMGSQLRAEINRRLQINIRIGAATNKLVSQLAAQKSLPQKIKEVNSGDEASFIAPFRIYLLPPVHGKIQTQMTDLNIKLIRDLAKISRQHLNVLFGKLGGQLYNFSHGIDSRPVQPPTRYPGVVEVRLLNHDTNDIELLLAVLLELVEKACQKLRRQHLVARKLNLFLRYSDYKEERGEIRFRDDSNREFEIYPPTRELLEQIYRRRIRIRQIAIKLSGLKPQSAQMSLFDTGKKQQSEQIMRAMDKIRNQFGYEAIQFARALCMRKTG